MPPMLDVALDELSRGGTQQMLARHLRLRCTKRHHVLELIAKAIGATDLVTSRARPDPARESLVQEPAVEQNVHRPIRRVHLHRAKDGIPALRRRTQYCVQI